MRIALLGLGSRGDVQPFVALGKGLRQAGHTVRLIGLADYVDLAETHDLPYSAVVGAAAELMDRDLVYESLESAGKRLPIGFARRFIAQITPLIERLVRECLDACVGAEVIVASTLGLYPGRFVAEKLGIALIPAHFHPYGSSRALPDLNFAELPAWLPLRGYYNHMTHLLSRHGLWQLLRGAFNRARRNLGLHSLSAPRLWQMAQQRDRLTLYGYSPHIAPPPPDWDTTRTITGYWFDEPTSTWTASAELQRFLANGPPPVYIGFGSVLAGRDTNALGALLVESLQQTGMRGVIYRGAWDDLRELQLPPEIISIGATPHDWLFPQMAAVVTHGGAGTVAAALRAGRPVISVPFYGDQRFWGQRVAALGAGTTPIPRAELSVATLSAAIRRAVGDAAMHRAAATISRALAAEDGVSNAIAAIVDR